MLELFYVELKNRFKMSGQITPASVKSYWRYRRPAAEENLRREFLDLVRRRVTTSFSDNPMVAVYSEESLSTIKNVVKRLKEEGWTSLSLRKRETTSCSSYWIILDIDKL